MTDNTQPILVGEAAVRTLMAALQLGASQSSGARSVLEAAEPDRAVFEELQVKLPSAIAALSASDHGDGVLSAPDDPLASLLQSFLAERSSANYATLVREGKLRASQSGGFEAKFDERDIAGWVLHFLPSWLHGRFSKRAFVPPANTVHTIPNDARIALLGDWGSGLYGAPICARSIQSASPRFAAVVHLGDVYYAGTTTEVQTRFLDAWPEVPGASNWAINSNHEMYSGGEGYFDRTLHDSRFGQGSSCFAFQNDQFLFVGLDTAYDDHDLSTLQQQWLADRLAAAGSRKLVLFSHHQPYSHFEKGGTQLVSRLIELLNGRRVFAWYWGHEHRCVIYDRHPSWGLWGRCVGHSGYPAFRDHFKGERERVHPDGSAFWRVASIGVPSALVLDGPNPYVTGHADRYSPNGYVSLKLDRSQIHETVNAPDGTVLFEHTITP